MDFYFWWPPLIVSDEVIKEPLEFLKILLSILQIKVHLVQNVKETFTVFSTVYSTGTHLAMYKCLTYGSHLYSNSTFRALLD